MWKLNNIGPISKGRYRCPRGWPEILGLILFMEGSHQRFGGKWVFISRYPLLFQTQHAKFLFDSTRQRLQHLSPADVVWEDDWSFVTVSVYKSEAPELLGFIMSSLQRHHRDLCHAFGTGIWAGPSSFSILREKMKNIAEEFLGMYPFWKTTSFPWSKLTGARFFSLP